VTVTYHLEEFSSFAAVRLNYKPEEATSVELMFVRNSNKFDSIKVLTGKEYKKVGEDPARFNCILTFDMKLIKHLKMDGIDSI